MNYIEGWRIFWGIKCFSLCNGESSLDSRGQSQQYSAVDYGVGRDDAGMVGRGFLIEEYNCIRGKELHNGGRQHSLVGRWRPIMDLFLKESKISILLWRGTVGRYLREWGADIISLQETMSCQIDQRFWTVLGWGTPGAATGINASGWSGGLLVAWKEDLFEVLTTWQGRHIVAARLASSADGS